MDVRDKMTWVALELTKAGEQKAIDSTLTVALRSALGIPDSHLVFVPYASYAKGGRSVSVRLIEGYAFVASGLVETRYFSLERGPFVERVMSTKGAHNMRVLQTVPDARIRSMMAQLREQVASDLEIGAVVKITGGNYLHLEGVIVDLTDDRAAVRIKLRSLDVVAFLPKVFIDVITEDGEDNRDEIDALDIAVGPEFIPED
jgi:transcription antitermination factor NusG